MKIRSALSILALILLMPIAVSPATETINMDVVANVDRFGDGSMKITFHLSAMQWAIWKQQYGDHPDVLWRDLKQTFAKYALDKFDLQKNDIERTAVVDISAHAFTHVRSDGKRGIEIPKEFRLVSNNGREWIFDFTNQQSPYSPILTQTNRIVLPCTSRSTGNRFGTVGLRYAGKSRLRADPSRIGLVFDGRKFPVWDLCPHLFAEAARYSAGCSGTVGLC